MTSERIPDETYTDRRHERVRLEKITRGDGDYCTVQWANSWGCGLPLNASALRVGQSYTLETKGFNNVAGLADPQTDEYLFRRSDQYFEEEHRKFVEELNASREKELREHREEYQAREDALPEPFRSRMRKFHEKPAFELEGWGYELIICELAVVMMDNPHDDGPADDFASKHGMSGNQFGCARALASYTKATGDVENVPSGLAPLNGGAW